LGRKKEKILEKAGKPSKGPTGGDDERRRGKLHLGNEHLGMRTGVPFTRGTPHQTKPWVKTLCSEPRRKTTAQGGSESIVGS